tara:strand:- start:6785 stop:7159 length:375 start_codon:yes stop_codon:yes gene_type:complete
MNYYEHTIVARQDTSKTQLKQIQEKYVNIIEKSDGKVLQTQNWGLLNLSYIVKKNKKGNFIHYKFQSNPTVILELEKNEKLDKNILKYLTIKVKKLDLNTNYFDNSNKEESGFKEENEKKQILR